MMNRFFLINIYNALALALALEYSWKVDQCDTEEVIFLFLGTEGSQRLNFRVPNRSYWIHLIPKVVSRPSSHPKQS